MGFSKDTKYVVQVKFFKDTKDIVTERFQPSQSTHHPRSLSSVVFASIAPPFWCEVLERCQSERCCPKSQDPTVSIYASSEMVVYCNTLIDVQLLGAVFTEHQSFAQKNPDPFLKPSLIYLQAQILIMSGKNVLCQIYLEIFVCKECQIKVQRYKCLPSGWRVLWTTLSLWTSLSNLHIVDTFALGGVSQLSEYVFISLLFRITLFTMQKHGIGHPILFALWALPTNFANCVSRHPRLTSVNIQTVKVKKMTMIYIHIIGAVCQ